MLAMLKRSAMMLRLSGKELASNLVVSMSRAVSIASSPTQPGVLDDDDVQAATEAVHHAAVAPGWVFRRKRCEHLICTGH
jgi:hypothetical protein